MTDWIILRTAPSKTLALAASLAEAGFEAWTPMVARVWREGESRTRKSEVVHGTPGYVFTRSERLAEMLGLSRTPALRYMVWDAELKRMVSRGHPAFTVMPDAVGYAAVSDRELEYLRRAERRDRPKQLTRPYRPGEEIRVIDGPYQGLSGVVAGVYGVHVEIEFPRSNHPVKIPMWMLQHLDELEMAA